MCEDGIEKSVLVMPICDPRDGFFYPYLTLMMDSYIRNPSHAGYFYVLQASPIFIQLTYCRFGNFRENFIFSNSIKRHISDVKNS